MHPYHHRGLSRDFVPIMYFILPFIVAAEEMLISVQKESRENNGEENNSHFDSSMLTTTNDNVYTLMYVRRWLVTNDEESEQA
jgi:hypothetical protein